MPARPAHEPAPDLFTTAAATKTVPPETPVIAPKVAGKSVPSAQRHLLPKDLPGALARLDDGEIDVLLAAVIEEAKRRDRPSPGLMIKSQVADQHPRGVSQSKTAATYARVHPRQTRAGQVRLLLASDLRQTSHVGTPSCVNTNNMNSPASV